MWQSCITSLSRGGLRYRGIVVLVGVVVGGTTPNAMANDSAGLTSDQTRLEMLLIDAVRAGNLATARRAVSAGAKITRRDGDGRSPLDIAISVGRFKFVEYLLLARLQQQQDVVSASRATETNAFEKILPGVAEQAPTTETAPLKGR